MSSATLFNIKHNHLETDRESPRSIQLENQIITRENIGISLFFKTSARRITINAKRSSTQTITYKTTPTEIEEEIVLKSAKTSIPIDIQFVFMSLYRHCMDPSRFYFYIGRLQNGECLFIDGTSFVSVRSVGDGLKALPLMFFIVDYAILSGTMTFETISDEHYASKSFLLFSIFNQMVTSLHFDGIEPLTNINFDIACFRSEILVEYLALADFETHWFHYFIFECIYFRLNYNHDIKSWYKRERYTQYFEPDDDLKGLDKLILETETDLANGVFGTSRGHEDTSNLYTTTFQRDEATRPNTRKEYEDLEKAIALSLESFTSNEDKIVAKVEKPKQRKVFSQKTAHDSLRFHKTPPKHIINNINDIIQQNVSLLVFQKNGDKQVEEYWMNVFGFGSTFSNYLGDNVDILTQKIFDYKCTSNPDPFVLRAAESLFYVISRLKFEPSLYKNMLMIISDCDYDLLDETNAIIEIAILKYINLSSIMDDLKAYDFNNLEDFQYHNVRALIYDFFKHYPQNSINIQILLIYTIISFCFCELTVKIWYEIIGCLINTFNLDNKSRLWKLIKNLPFFADGSLSAALIYYHTTEDTLSEFFIAKLLKIRNCSMYELENVSKQHQTTINQMVRDVEDIAPIVHDPVQPEETWDVDSINEEEPDEEEMSFSGEISD